jgi:hypothetical protein
LKYSVIKIGISLLNFIFFCQMTGRALCIHRQPNCVPFSCVLCLSDVHFT